MCERKAEAPRVKVPVRESAQERIEVDFRSLEVSFAVVGVEDCGVLYLSNGRYGGMYFFGAIYLEVEKSQRIWARKEDGVEASGMSSISVRREIFVKGE